jgi:hypothetical protein
MSNATQSSYERVQAEQARLDETLTRREVVQAINRVASDYGGNGTHESDLIADAFRALARALS